MSIKLIKVSKRYMSAPFQGQAVEAVKNISIDINEGTYTCFIGPTGSGKTTLLGLLCGIIKPTGGDVVLHNLHVPQSKDREVCRFRERYIGYIPQETFLIRDLNILENILSPNAFSGNSIGSLKEHARMLLERLKLGEKAACMPSELSGGEKKKLMIARALLKSPLYIIADEPVSELDRESTDDVMELFYEYSKRGSAVVIAGHKSLNLLREADIYTIQAGRIIQHRKGGKT